MDKFTYVDTDGNKKELIVVRKGIDGFGKESVVFGSTTSCAQFYCCAKDVPLWHIEKQWKAHLVGDDVVNFTL